MITVVGILGELYCGSTALGMALNSHPDVSFIGESSQGVKPWYDLHFRRYGKPVCYACRGDDPCPVWAPDDIPVETSKVHRTLAERLGVSFVADSSKQPQVFEAYEAANSADRYVYVVLIKTPERQLASYRRHQTPNPDAWPRRYGALYDRILRFVSTRRHRIYSYLRFAQEPRAVLDELAELIGVDASGFDPVDYKSRTIHQISGNWRAIRDKAPISLDTTWGEYAVETSAEDLDRMESTYRRVLAPPSKQRPKVLATYDREGWAFHRIARMIREHLSDEFDIEVQPYLRAPLTRADAAIFLWYGCRAIASMLPDDCRLVTCLYDGYTWKREDGNRKSLEGAAAYSDAFLFANRGLLKETTDALRGLPPIVGTCEDGVDTEFFSPSLMRSQRPAGTLRVGWTGARFHGTIKGLDLIEAACKDLDGVTLDIAAREDRWRTPEEMVQWYGGIDAYLCASVAEGTPNPILEASACGIPWISTRVGIVPDLWESAGGDPRPGLLVDRTVEDLRAAIVTLRDDPALAAAMGAAGRSTVVAHWTWAERMEAFRTALRAVLNRPVRRAPGSLGTPAKLPTVGAPLDAIPPPLPPEKRWSAHKAWMVKRGKMKPPR